MRIRGQGPAGPPQSPYLLQGPDEPGLHPGNPRPPHAGQASNRPWQNGPSTPTRGLPCPSGIRPARSASIISLVTRIRSVCTRSDQDDLPDCRGTLRRMRHPALQANEARHAVAVRQESRAMKLVTDSPPRPLPIRGSRCAAPSCCGISGTPRRAPSSDSGLPGFLEPAVSCAAAGVWDMANR
jgi:hypothetical protein